MKLNRMNPLFIILLIGLGSNSCIRRTHSETLHTYIVLDMALVQQRTNYEIVNADLLSRFQNAVVLNPQNDSVKNLNEQSIKVALAAKNLSDFITNMKVELVAYADEVTNDKAKEIVVNPFLIKRMADYKRTTSYFGTNDPPGENGKAHELKVQLEQYKSFLLNFVVPGDMDLMSKKLELLNPTIPEDKDSNNSWEMFYFYHAPLPGALAVLSRLQVIVRQAEGEVLTYLLNTKSKGDQNL
jgi:hypothetical protein